MDVFTFKFGDYVVRYGGVISVDNVLPLREVEIRKEVLKRFPTQESAIKDWLSTANNTDLCEMIWEYPETIQHCVDAPDYIKTIALMQDGLLIKWFVNPTADLRRIAILQNSHSIKFFDATEEEQILAVSRSSLALKHINLPSESLKVAAALRYWSEKGKETLYFCK